MRKDAQGLALTTDNDATVTAVDGAVEAGVQYTLAGTPPAHAALTADPDFALGHCLRGYLAMLASNRALLPMVVAARDAGLKVAARATSRERLHFDALDAWQRGALD